MHTLAPEPRAHRHSAAEWAARRRVLEALLEYAINDTNLYLLRCDKLSHQSGTGAQMSQEGWHVRLIELGAGRTWIRGAAEDVQGGAVCHGLIQLLLLTNPNPVHGYDIRLQQASNLPAQHQALRSCIST